MWNKLRKFICLRFRRFLLLLGSLAVILLVVFLPLSASAETVNIKPTYSNMSLNYLSAEVGFPFSLTNVLEDQYTYGGLYNPLILIGSTSKWQTALCSVRWNFGKTLSAGTVLSIQCGAWHHKAYAVDDKFMYASLTPPTNDANLNAWISERQALSTNSIGYVQTSNGVYHGYLYSGTYTLPANSSYIYLVFQLNLSSQRNSNLAVGQHCNSISYEANHVSPAESDSYGTPESGALDDTSAALGDLDNAESALLQENSAGLSSGQSLLSDAKLVVQQFVLPLQAVGKLFNKMIEKIPISGLLVTVSGSLGLFMFLLGMVGEVYGRSQKRDRYRSKNDKVNRRRSDSKGGTE